MKLRPEEITSILKQRIEQYDVETDLSEVGTVLQVGDGIARVYGLENCVALERLEFEHGVVGIAFNLEEDNVGVALFGEWQHVKEGEPVRRTGAVMDVPVGEGLLGRVVDPLGNPLDGQGPIEARASAARVQGAGRHPAAAGRRAAPDRPQGDRLDDPDRPWPARADHRRPRHRQDRDRRRHDHQPARRRRDLHLRRGRPEGVHRGAGRRAAPRRGRDGLHDRRLGPGPGGGADQVDGAVRRRRDGRALPLRRQARARHLRRPHEARGRVPAALPAAPPPAGPRGVPGRRLLSPLAAARARVQALGRPRRRLAHRAADHRDAGGRRRGVHPDERHLDHGRADLPRVEPLLLGHPAGDQRRHLGLPRGRERADEGDEEGRGTAAPRPRPVPRARGVLAVRLGARRGDAAVARRAASGWSRR